MASAQSSAGVAQFMRTTDPSFDTYINSPSLSTQQWLQQHFAKMLVYSPYFDTRLSWYPNGFVYIDSYAIYTGSALATQHPEWILKDSSGRKLYIPWGCSGGTCPQYAADTSNAAFRQYWISQAAPIIAKGYKGLFMDDVNMNFTVGDGYGNFVNPVDPNTGALMTWDAWRSYMAGFTEQVRAAFPAIEIIHNSVWYSGPSGVRDQDPYIKRQIAAANYQFIEFGVNDGGITGGTGIWSLNSLLGYVDRLHGLNNGAIFSGVATDAIGREYALANYFLISGGKDGLGNTVTTPDTWWTGYDVNLGTPSGARTTWNNLLRRDFSGGMVLVNPPQSASITVTLPATYKRVDGTSVTSITLGGSQGAVLLSTTQSGSDTSAPTVSIGSPANGSTVSGNTSITASASDNVGVAAVDFYVDNVFQGSATTAPYALMWYTTNWAEGSHSLKAVARDAAGNQGTSAVVTATVANKSSADTTPPTVSIASPTNGATVSGIVTVTAAASDNVGVASVDFYVDGVFEGTKTAPYTLTWYTTYFAEGSHTLKAVARDAAGNTATSAIVTATVSNQTSTDRTAPTVRIITPVPGWVSGWLTINASATDNVGVVGVKFYLDGVQIAPEVTAGPTGIYSLSWNSAVLTGHQYHTLSAVARDAAGNTGSAQVQVKSK
jgi:hypothetical protein